MNFRWLSRRTVGPQNASNGVNESDSPDDLLNILDKEIEGDEWLKSGTSHLFLCELLSKVRSPQNIQGVRDTLGALRDLFRRNETIVPDDIPDNPHAIASGLLQIGVKTMISVEGELLAERRTLKELQQYFTDKWSYRPDAVRRMVEKCKYRCTSVEIRKEAEDWIKATAATIKQTDEHKLRQKLQSVTREIQLRTRDGGKCCNRAKTVEALLEYEPWGSPKSRLCELVSCSDDSRVTVVMLNFHECQVEGLASLCARETGLNELAKWKCTKGGNADSEAFSFSSNVYPPALLSPRAGKGGRGALCLTPVRDDWCVLKHREEDRYMLLGTTGDTLLVNRNGLVVACATENIGDEMNANWRIEWE